MFLFSLLLLLFPPKKQTADLIVKNAVVYTVDAQFSKATAFAVKNGKFLAVGPEKEILQKYTAKQIIDAQQKAIYPGFYDPHSHFMGLGQMLDQADLVGTISYEEIITRLKKYAQEHPEKDWIVGRGWDQNDWQNKNFPDKTLLDAAFPDKPVLLTRIDGHATLVNSKALRLAKVSAGSQVDGGLVEVKNNEPTGILIDNAMNLMRRVMPPPSKEEKEKMLQNAEKVCLAYGLTSVSDAGLNRDDIDLINEMHQKGKLKIRDYAMISIGVGNLEYYLKKGIHKTDRLNVRSFKIYADGALGSRGACLLQPYSDAPTSGFLLMSPTELERNFTALVNSPFQVNTHCIGDSANRLVLDLYGKVLKTKNDRRWRIEHAQIVSQQDMPKFGQFSVIPSIQATHATSDMYWADERLGEPRIKTAYPFKELLAQNGLIANGSDFPVEAVNPLFGFHAAVARQDAQNYPASGFQMENALNREQALRAMTIWAAYANFEEKERGSIEAGKMADFVILEQDLMTVPTEANMRNIAVLKTFIGGELLYQR